MVYDIIHTAIHWWCADRSKKGLNDQIRVLLPFIFQTTDSLYDATRNIPSVWGTPQISGYHIEGINSRIFSVPLSTDRYILLRAILSLTSDLYLLLETLMKSRNLMELDLPLGQFYDSANCFRDIRNFFSHLNDRLSNLATHGISGENKTNCGIEYFSKARNCFHLVVTEDKIHFTSNRQVLEADISKKAFDPIFESARLVYAEIVSHNIHSKTYPSATDIYLT